MINNNNTTAANAVNEYITTTIGNPSSAYNIYANDIVAGTILNNHSSNGFALKTKEEKKESLPFNKLYILPFNDNSKIGAILMNYIQSVNPLIKIWLLSVKNVQKMNEMSSSFAVDIKHEDEVNDILKNFTKFYGNDYKHLLPYKEEISNVSIVNYDFENNHYVVTWLVENCTKQFYGIGNTSIVFESEIDMIAFKMKFL